MLCCLNPHCDQPINPDGMKFCCHCGTPLGLLRNHYRPLKPLGEGGFIRIYLAEDIDKLNSHCVIKQLAPNVEGSWALQKAKTIVSGGSRDGTIKIWDLATGKLLRTLTGHSEVVLSVAISPDGQTIVSGSDDKTIKIWRLKR